MAEVQGAPIQDPIIEGNEGKARITWILFFNRLLGGDPGQVWSPIYSNLTIVGAAPTVSGVFYKNNGWIDFWIQIIPGTNTSATAGTTYFDLPFDVAYNAACFAVSGGTGSNSGMINASDNRCYVPAWSAVTVPLTIVGRCKEA